MKIHVHVPNHLIIISMVVFLILNIIENIIHFSIGRNVEGKYKTNIKIEIPEPYDILKITIIMIIFAILQALFTYFGVFYGL